MYKLLLTFLNSASSANSTSRYSENPTHFLNDIKDLMFENLNKYRSTVDVMNFQDIFEEVLKSLHKIFFLKFFHKYFFIIIFLLKKIPKI